jgi:hypothetical protein
MNVAKASKPAHRAHGDGLRDFKPFGQPFEVKAITEQPRAQDVAELITIIVIATPGAGYLEARQDGRLLPIPRQPFLDSACVLISEGRKPDVILEMRRGEARFQREAPPPRIALPKLLKPDPNNGGRR